MIACTSRVYSAQCTEYCCTIDEGSRAVDETRKRSCFGMTRKMPESKEKQEVHCRIIRPEWLLADNPQLRENRKRI